MRATTTSKEADFWKAEKGGGSESVTTCVMLAFGWIERGEELIQVVTCHLALGSAGVTQVAGRAMHFPLGHLDTGRDTHTHNDRRCTLFCIIENGQPEPELQKLMTTYNSNRSLHASQKNILQISGEVSRSRQTS